MKKSTKNNQKANEGDLSKITYLADPENNIFALATILTDQVSHKFKAHLNAHYNFTLADWRVIKTLMRYPNLTALGITNHWGMDKMIINRSIKRLEKDDFLVRVQGFADRRSYKLTLTPKGRKLFLEAAPGSIDLYLKYMGAISDNEQKALRESLQKIIANLEAIPD